MGTNLVKSKKFDIDNSAFLAFGSAENYMQYLIYFYSIEIKGNEDEKFEQFEQILNGSDDIQDFLVSEGIKMPDSATMVNCPGGFFDSMTEEQAKKFYDIIKPLIPTE